MTKKAVEENENVGKMDWDVMNKVLKNTINLDDEGSQSDKLFLKIEAFFQDNHCKVVAQNGFKNRLCSFLSIDYSL